MTKICVSCKHAFERGQEHVLQKGNCLDCGELIEARGRLRKNGVFFYEEPFELGEGDDPNLLQTLNLNDTWGWATADGEYVPDSELIEVDRLFFAYGWCGIMYWVSERRDRCRSDFHHFNRMIDFVRFEEEIRKEVPESHKRAYYKTKYMIGDEP